MYVNFQLVSTYNYNGTDYLEGNCVQISDLGKLTNTLFENIITQSIFYGNLKDYFERNNRKFSISLSFNESRNHAKFELLSNGNKFGWGYVNIVNWEDIWRV